MSAKQDKKIKRVGVLRGGDEKYYTSSLKKGGEIILHIHQNLSHKWKPFDILIDKKGTWHINGLPILPSDLMHKVDVVWNTSHSSLTNILESLSIPHIGQGSFHFSLENSKEMLRQHMKQINLDMPRAVVLPVYQKDFDGPMERYSIKKAKEVHEKFPAPWIVKSFTPDTNMGIHLAKTFQELVDAIEDGVRHEKSVLVEEFIYGKVATVHNVPQFRKKDIYTFPLGNTFGVFSSDEKEVLTNLAKDIYNHTGAKHYLKTDFVMNPRGKVYLIQIDGTPDLKEDSHLTQVCVSVGAKTQDIVEHILEAALRYAY
ncbi:MAG: hypothetical protein WCP17_00020 [bacterium]